LNHRNIMTVHCLGARQGVPYLVCELLKGQTLREELRKGPLPLRKTVDYPPRRSEESTSRERLKKGSDEFWGAQGEEIGLGNTQKALHASESR
jgi:hypothetical protein